MKRRKASGQKPAKTTSLPGAKIFSRFTRVQILGAATLVAGIILVVLLLRDEEVPTPDTPALPASSKVLATGDRTALENEPAIKGANRPPVVTAVMLSPDVVFPGVVVRVEVKASDPDQNEVRLIYTWKINGEVVAEQSGEEFDTTSLHKGDLLTVSVIPDDGKELGQPRESNGILIQNRPPEITSMPPAGISSGFFQYQVAAQDPDSDILTYSLGVSPHGMQIEASTGLIQWDVPRGLSGKQQVRIVVSDGTANSFQAFNLNLGQ